MRLDSASDYLIESITYLPTGGRLETRQEANPERSFCGVSTAIVGDNQVQFCQWQNLGRTANTANGSR